jgi:hypothetical protein
MPLSAPAERQPLHTRRVTCKGYFRRDGLFEIEGHITDEKSYDQHDEYRGDMRAGDFVHNMRIRLTVDARMTIVDAEAATDNSPYRICGQITPSFKKLIGLRIAPGFHREVKARLGGVHGCTHLVELLGPVATTAFQTIDSDRALELRQAWEAEQAAASSDTLANRAAAARSKGPPTVLNTCHAWASDGEVVARWAPDYYTGGDAKLVRKTRRDAVEA